MALHRVHTVHVCRLMTGGVSDAWGTRSDWIRHCQKSLTFLNFLMQATETTERIDPQCISRVPDAKSMRSIQGRAQCERGVRATNETELHV